VLLDRSASMQTTNAGGSSQFEAALQVARDELRQLDEQTSIHVGLFDAAGVETIAIDQVGRRLQAGEAATDYGAALAWARDLMVSSTRPRRKVILITDLQRTGLDRTALQDFPADAELVVRDVGRAMVQNVALEDCTPVRTEIRPKEPVRIAARVYNGGALPARNVPVELSLRGPTGVIQRKQEVTLLGGARQTVEFELPELTADGIYEGSVLIDRRDDLQLDNRRWVAFESRHPDRLLLVDGQQGRSVYTNETYYLETALRLRMPFGLGPERSFEIERIVWEDGNGFPSLEGFRAVVLCNVARLRSTDADRLRQYVSDGGNLLIFGGDQTTPTILAALREAGLMSGQLAGQPVKGLFRCRNWDRQHPVFRPFDDPQQGDLRRIGFDQLLEIRDLAPEAKVLIEAGPYPLVVEQPLGKGTTLLVTAAADRDWGDWPQSRLYVPLVRQIMAYLTDQLEGRQPVRNLLVQQLGAGTDSAVPAGTEGGVLADSTKTGDAKSGAASRAGIVQEGTVRVVRNIDPRESILDRVSADELRELLNLDPKTPQQAAAGVQ
jgi:hypothetical protein